MKLKEIQDFIQDAIGAISQVLEVEVTVIDYSGYRIAGTGCFKDRIGEKIPDDWALAEIMKEGSSKFLEKSGGREKCQVCKHHLDCLGTTIVATPIITDEEIVGLISLVGFYKTQKQKLISKSQEALSFLNYMANLIASKLSEQNMLKSLELSRSQLCAVFNSVPQGIIAMDRHQVITHFSMGAENITGLHTMNVRGKNIQSMFKLSVQECVQEGIGYANKNVTLDTGEKIIRCFASISPIYVKDQIDGAIVLLRETSEVHKLVQDITMDNTIDFQQIIGVSSSIQAVKEQAIRVAKGTSTVLLTGESGTGKELFARSIHAESKDKKGPFVAINCAAIPETLLESELFGYEEGAFSGSKKGGKPGKFELAHGGTIFLDEIGDMPLVLQSKLLRVLENCTVERIGGTKPYRVSFRLITATNKDLKKLVDSGQFRADLYYRINVIPIHLPPLRNRNGDIPLLMDLYLKKYCLQMESQALGFSQEVLELFLNYPWPGNIRELRNVIEYAVNMETEQTICIDSLPESFMMSYFTNNITVYSTVKSNSLDLIERNLIEEAIKKYGDSTKGKRQVAKVLGISLATLYRRLKEFDKQ